MEAKGPRDERETIVIFNDAEDDAHVWTASEIVYRRLRKRGWWPNEDGERHAEFTIPKKFVRFSLNPHGKVRKPRGFAIKPSKFEPPEAA